MGKEKNKYSMTHKEFLEWMKREREEFKEAYSKLSPKEKRQEELLNKEIEEDVKWDYNRFQKQKEILEKKLKSAKTKKEREEIENEMEINKSTLFKTKGMIGEKPPKLPLALRIRIKLDKIFNKEK